MISVWSVSWGLVVEGFMERISRWGVIVGVGMEVVVVVVVIDVEVLVREVESVVAFGFGNGVEDGIVRSIAVVTTKMCVMADMIELCFPGVRKKMGLTFLLEKGSPKLKSPPPRVHARTIITTISCLYLRT